MMIFRKLVIFIVVTLFSHPFANADKLLIGLDADMSSGAKAGGLAIQRGAQIAIEEINTNGGINGKQLELVTRDHKGNPARGISNLKKFAKMDNLIAVLGGVHTPVVLQELEIIHQNKLLFLVPWAAGTPITSNKYNPNFVFRVSIRDKEAGPVLVNYAQSINAQSISLVLERTGWGRSNKASMTAAAESLGLNVAGIHWVNWGEKNIETQLSALETENPDAIMLVANAPEGIVVTKGLISSALLKSKPIISHWGIAGGSYVSGVGLERINKLDISTIQTFSFVNAYDEEIANRVLNTYKEKFVADADQKNIPGVVGLAQAYDLVHMLAIAVKDAGVFKRSKIRDALENLKSHKGLIKNYTSPFNAGQHDALLRDDYFISKFNNNGHLVPR
ncbi:ABC transporter substrate-binding protein [Oleiphilus sp. HI0125]|uniref:ABC transporter substrate-binding protein n=1 Tax=Oleiphilus sp. HI0125 TaxID=1822266 RepID=UPI0009ED6F0F|nr:ABC transporter substrate-binding protein [Oleiphilus sp. HI0125]